MKLETESGGERNNPTPSDIEAALSELERDGGFLILSRADEDYVQAAGSAVEYRQEGRHFQHIVHGPDRDLVRQIFMSYYHDDGRFKEMVDWQDISSTFDIRPTGQSVQAVPYATAPYALNTEAPVNAAPSIAGKVLAVVIGLLIIGGGAAVAWIWIASK